MFNLKKYAQSVNNSVLPVSSALEDSSERRNSLSEEKFIPNFNNYLEKDHKETKDVVLLQAQLESKRASNDNPQVIEKMLDASDSALYPHRQSDGIDRHDVMPINLVSESHDRKFREAFSEQNNDADTSFWDKFVGEQLDDKDNRKKIISQNPKSSQLQNNPDRFGNLQDLPVFSDAEENRDHLLSKATVEPMAGFRSKEKGIDMMDSLREADRVMFETYFKAASEGRGLNNLEKEIIAGIDASKKKILLSQMSQMPSPEDRRDMETDFLDGGNDPTAGDPLLWASMSGYNPSHEDAGLEDSGLANDEIIQAEPSLENLPALPSDSHGLDIDGGKKNDDQTV